MRTIPGNNVMSMFRYLLSSVENTSNTVLPIVIEYKSISCTVRMYKVRYIVSSSSSILTYTSKHEKQKKPKKIYLYRHRVDFLYSSRKMVSEHWYIYIILPISSAKNPLVFA